MQKIFFKEVNIEKIKMESNQEFNKLFKEYEAKVDQANQTYKDLSEIMKKINKFLVNDRENLYKIESMMVKYKKNESEIVKFNVGGTTFSTHKTTVNKKIVKPDTNGNEFYEPNLLQGLISGIIDVNYDEDNKTIFIDRDPKYFNFILNYLRSADSENIAKFKLPKDIDSLNDIYEEADYYQLDGLKDIIYPKRFSDSLILSVSEAYKLNSFCEFSKNDSFSLIYRGSRDGFSAQNFHSKCDNIGKTLTIIKTNQSYIFGKKTILIYNKNNKFNKFNIFRWIHRSYLGSKSEQ